MLSFMSQKVPEVPIGETAHLKDITPKNFKKLSTR